jgi:hypothetical protein
LAAYFYLELHKASHFIKRGDYCGMTTTALREKMIEEIARIPESKLSELYDVIHIFRIGLDSIAHPKTSEEVQDILDATDGIYGLWEDREFDVDGYVRDLRKDRSPDHD